MTYHIRSHHTGEKPYHCPDCKCTFGLEVNLNTHSHVCHQSQSIQTISSPSASAEYNFKKHFCTTCGKELSHSSKVSHHNHIHNKGEAYVCKDCEKRFTQSGILISHSCIHNKERAYICKTVENDLLPLLN